MQDVIYFAAMLSTCAACALNMSIRGIDTCHHDVAHKRGILQIIDGAKSTVERAVDAKLELAKDVVEGALHKGSVLQPPQLTARDLGNFLSKRST